MRAVAGGLAADLPLSEWFLMVAGFGSLFIVAGKRYSELHTLGSEAGTRRSPGPLHRHLPALRLEHRGGRHRHWPTACGPSSRPPSTGIPWHTHLDRCRSCVGLLRYAVDIDAGTAAEPEDIVWRDRVLQGIGVVWLVHASASGCSSA